MYEDNVKKYKQKMLGQAARIQSINLMGALQHLQHTSPAEFLYMLFTLTNGEESPEYEYFEEKLSRQGNEVIEFTATPWLKIGVARPDYQAPYPPEGVMYYLLLKGRDIELYINMAGKRFLHRCSIDTLHENGAVLLGMFGPQFIPESIAVYLMNKSGEDNLDDICTRFMPFDIMDMPQSVESYGLRDFTSLEIGILDILGYYKFMSES